MKDRSSMPAQRVDDALNEVLGILWMVLRRRGSIARTVLMNVPLMLTRWSLPRPSKMVASAARSCSARMPQSRVRP